METNNETVEQVALSDRPLAEQIRIIRGNYCIGSGEFDALDEAADVVECHKREIAAKDNELMIVADHYVKVIECKERLIASRNVEIATLRALVKELADVAERFISCKSTECETTCGVGERCIHLKAIKLVAKAREVCNG